MTSTITQRSLTILTAGETAPRMPTRSPTSATSKRAGPWSDRLLGSFGFLLMVAYWPGISGAATTPRWCLIALLGLPLVFLGRPMISIAHLLGLGLMAWLTIAPGYGFKYIGPDYMDEAFRLILSQIAFIAGTAIVSLDALFVGAAIGLGVNSVVVIAQAFGWHGVEQYGGGALAGLFFNPGRLGAAAAMVAVGVIGARRWALLPLIAPAVILSGSHASWVAVLAGLVGRRPKDRQSALGMGIAIGTLVGIVVAAAFTNSGAERLAIWRDTVAGLNVLGHGLGSFRDMFPQFANHFDLATATTRPEHPHNEWLWLTFEGGLPALGLALCFVATCLKAGQGHALVSVVVAFVALSLVAMPFHDPATLALFALVAGHLVGRGAVVDDLALDRRNALRARLRLQEHQLRNGGAWPGL